jgi:predicted nucleotidyltransferase component of viral defense system
MTQQGINVDAHKRVLTMLLLEICRSIGTKIAFKGGTASMIFYSLPRFSLDLDFDVLKEITSKEEEAISLILNKRGRILEQENKRHTLFFLFDYEKGRPNVKLEFNKRIWQNNRYLIKQLMGVQINVQDEATTLSNKMVALIERKNPVPRDLFDIHYFLTIYFRPNPDLIRERAGMELDDFIQKLIEAIDVKFSDKSVLYGLGELINASQQSWAKRMLIPETKRLLEEMKSKIDKTA